MTFRSPLGAQTAGERVAAAQRRILLAADSGYRQIRAQRIQEGVLLRLGPRPIFTITPLDVDTIGGETFETLVRATVDRMGTALDARADQYSIRSIVRGVVFSVVVTAVFLLVLRTLRLLRRLLQRRLDVTARRRLREVAIAGFKLLDRDRIVLFGKRSIEIFIWTAGLFVSYLWLTFVLTQFAYSRPWGEALGNYLLETLSSLLGSMVRSIPGLFMVVVIIVLTRVASRLVGAFFAAVQSESVKVAWLHADTAQPTRRIVIAVMWLFAIAVSYPYLPGSDTDVFKGVSVFAGLIITLGSTGVMGQAMSGLVLMYSRSLRIGEYVQIGTTEGEVADLGILATKIRTPKGELVTIPNAVVVTTATKNYSRYSADGGVLLYTTVTIGYDAPWRQVHALLIDAALRTPGVRAEPKPFVLQTALSDFHIEYQLNICVDQPERRVAILAGLHANIQDSFNEHGVQIMSPHFRAQPDQLVLVPRNRWYDAPAQPEP